LNLLLVFYINTPFADKKGRQKGDKIIIRLKMV